MSNHSRNLPIKTMLAAATLALSACGGGGGSATVAAVVTKPNAGPLSADQPLAKAFDSAAKAFSDSTDNPVLKWHYRVWCQTGYRSVSGAGTGQTVDTVADPAQDLVSPLGFNYGASLGKNTFVGGSRFMDNAWYFGNEYTGLVIVRLPDGSLIMLDALTTPDDMQKQVIDQMPAAGLNPANIKYIFIGHEHGDHYGGVELIKKNHAPNAIVVASSIAAKTILASRAKAEAATYSGSTAAEQTAARDAALLRIPAKIDVLIDATPGQTTGMQRVAISSAEKAVAMLAPGHTPGQLHVIIPVVHKGQTRKLFVWSGNDQPDQADQYALSTDFVGGLAFQESADSFINTHAYQGAMFVQLRAAQKTPSVDTALLMGKQGVQRYMGIFANCQRAMAERLRDGTWQTF